MAQNKNTGLNIEELKKSLKTLSAEMNPEQLRRANETLEKLESVTAKGNKENVEIQETNIKIEKSLGKNGDLNKSLLQLQKLYKESQKENLKLSKQQLAKLDKLGQPDIKKVGPIREDSPLTVREGLKEMVASGKSTVSSVVGGVKSIGSGIRDVFTKPGDVFNKVKGKVAAAYETGKEFLKDVASTEKGYDVRGERFGDRTALSKADQRKEQGSLLDPKLAARLDKNVAKVSYKKMLGAEEGLIEANKKISEFERSGLPVPKELMKQKETLEKTHRESDVRNTFAPVATKAATKVKAPEGAAEKANEATEKSAVETLTKARAENPEADNVVSANEKMADSLNDLSLTSKDLLSATKESVDILKGIRADLASDDIQALKSEPFERVGEVAANDSSGGLNASDVVGTAGDLLGNRGSKTPGKGFPRGKGPSIPGKAGLGSRILQGGKGLIGKGGNLIKGAIGGISAGGAVAAATTIGGGLALNYGLTKGADAITEAAGADTNVTPEMEAQDQANWDKASFFEKAQSGVARGIEGVGGFLGADKTVAAAKASRIKSETEYLKNKEAEAKPSETVSGDKLSPSAAASRARAAASRARWDRKAENVRRVNEETKAGTYKTEAEKAGITNPAETAAGEKVGGKGGPNWEAAKKDLEQGLPPPGSPSYEMDKKVLELAQLSTPRSDRPQSIENHIEMLKTKAMSSVAGLEGKTGTAKLIGMQPAAAEGKLSSDPQMDQDIKAQRKRAAEVTPSRPSSKSGELSNSSLEYNDLTREAAQPKPTPAPVIMNNSSNNSTTKIMPMKADPRPSDRGSAYERHIERTSAY